MALPVATHNESDWSVAMNACMCCKRWLETWKGFAVSFLRFFDALSRLCSYVTAFCNHRNGNRQDRKVCLSSFPVRGLGQIINFGNQLLHVKRWYLQLGAVRSCCSFAAAFGDWRNVSLQCVFLLNCSKNAPQSAPNWRNCLRVTASLNFWLIRILIRKKSTPECVRFTGSTPSDSFPRRRSFVRLHQSSHKPFVLRWKLFSACLSTKVHSCLTSRSWTNEFYVRWQPCPKLILSECRHIYLLDIEWQVFKQL